MECFRFHQFIVNLLTANVVAIVAKNNITNLSNILPRWVSDTNDKIQISITSMRGKTLCIG